MQRSLLAPAAAALILGLPYVALGAWLQHAKGLQSLAAFVVSVVLLQWLLAMAARNWRLFLLLQFPLLLLSVLFAAYTISLSGPPSDFIAYVLATTSWEEVRGFLGIWQGTRWLLAAVMLALVYLALALWCAPQPISSGRNLRIRYSMLGAVAVMSAYAANSPAAFIDGIAVNPVIGTAMFLAGPMRMAVAQVNGTGLHKVRYGASRSGPEEVHILIIGESARRASWSVYGYERKTTPYLEQLGSEAVFFQHAVADANYTARVVPILLTGMSPDRFDMGNVRGNLVDLAKEAGYSTAWLMNQDPHVSLAVGVHADQMHYPPPISSVMAGHLPLDEVLLPDLQRALERRGAAQFIGLHVIGSHWEYLSRYPASFQRYDIGHDLGFMSASSPSSGQHVVNSYDNSVIYTDWFLQQVIERARKLSVPATVTFISDHGEDLYALDGNAGHGSSTYTAHQFDIPGFVWMNAAYRDAHADKARAIAQNAGEEIRSHNFFYSMADLMGIRWPGESPAQSFASASFVPDTNTPVIAGDKLVAFGN